MINCVNLNKIPLKDSEGCCCVLFSHWAGKNISHLTNFVIGSFVNPPIIFHLPKNTTGWFQGVPRLINQELCFFFSGQQPLHHSRPEQCPHYCKRKPPSLCPSTIPTNHRSRQPRCLNWPPTQTEPDLRGHTSLWVALIKFNNSRLFQLIWMLSFL